MKDFIRTRLKLWEVDRSVTIGVDLGELRFELLRLQQNSSLFSTKSMIVQNKIHDCCSTKPMNVHH